MPPCQKGANQPSLDKVRDLRPAAPHLTPFSPLRFSKYSRDLSNAILDLSREQQMTPISRLKDKLSKAAGVAQRAASAIEAEADALIAQEDDIKSKTTDAFAPHKAILAEAGTELQAIKDALNLMSNGGPSLDPLHDAGPTAPGSDPKYPTYP
jgi:hypothetical protein